MWPTIALEEFLADPQKVLNKIAASSDIYFITENGKPIPDIRPFRSVPNEKMRGSVLAEGDIVSPIEADGSMRPSDDTARYSRVDLVV